MEIKNGGKREFTMYINKSCRVRGKESTRGKAKVKERNGRERERLSKRERESE